MIGVRMCFAVSSNGKIAKQFNSLENKQLNKFKFH